MEGKSETQPDGDSERMSETVEEKTPAEAAGEESARGIVGKPDPLIKGSIDTIRRGEKRELELPAPEAVVPVQPDRPKKLFLGLEVEESLVAEAPEEPAPAPSVFSEARTPEFASPAERKPAEPPVIETVEQETPETPASPASVAEDSAPPPEQPTPTPEPELIPEAAIPEAKPPESPTREVRFTTPEARSRWGKLSEGAKEIVRALYERTNKNNVADRAKLMFHNALFKWHDARTRVLAETISRYNSEAATLEATLAGQRLSSLQKRFWAFAIDVEGEGSRERSDIQAKLDQIKFDRERAQADLEVRSVKRAQFEYTRNNLIDTMSGRIRAKLQPYETLIGPLQEKKGRLDDEIHAFQERQHEFAQRFGEVAREAATAKFGSERRMFARVMKEIKNEMAHGKNYAMSRIYARASVEEQLRTLRAKADAWREKIENLQKIKSGLNAATERPTSAAQEETPEAMREPAKTMKFGLYVREWNKYFGSELPVDEKTFFESTRVVDEQMEMSQLEHSLRAYRRSLARQGKSVLSEHAFEKRLRSLRLYIGI